MHKLDVEGICLTLTQLALQRAGFSDLQTFQRANGLYPSGQEDILTMQLLEPYIFGYQRYMIQPEDTYFRLAQQFGVTVASIEAANPNTAPTALIPGQYLNIPLAFDVVPTRMAFTSQLLEVCIRGLQARYPFLHTENLTVTDYGRPVPCLRMGEGERVVAYNASHHANEWITTPVLMRFLEQYAQAYVNGEEIFGYAAGDLYRRCTLYLVPMVNPDGVDLVTGAISPSSFAYRQAKNLAANYPAIAFPEGWKANLNGVDLNLNYPAGWEQAKEIKFAQGYTQPGPRDFVGQAPLDQRESEAMVALTRRVNPALTIAYHTQGQEIYWKYQDMEPEGAQAVGEEFARVSGYALENVPYASGFAGYKDWFILTYNRPGYTIEAGRGENPLPVSQFDQIYQDNIGILTLGLVV